MRLNVLVRTQSAADKFKTLGVNAVVGSLDDNDLLFDLSLNMDVVLSMVY